MPGSTPATSQLDWLSSTTAMIVLSWSKATRDLLKAFSWGIGALRQLFASDDGAISFAACPIPSLRRRETDSNFRFPAMVNLVVVPFVPRGCSGWIGARGREYRGSARLSCAVSPPRCRRIRAGELHVHPRQIA